jgi:transforming growth factor-beta-induced protein
MKSYLTLATTLLLSGSILQADSIAKIASKNDSFTILAKALEVTGLDKALDGSGEFTVFAPTDEAFRKLPKGTIEELLKPESKEKLTSILKYHVVGSAVSSRQAVALDSAPTLLKEDLKITFEKAKLFVNDSRVVDTDIKASNGIIHVIDAVLIPETATSDPKTVAAKKMLTEAVDSGVDLFNAGNHAACEAIYKVAVRGILHIAPPTLDSADLERLEKAIETVESNDGSRRNAWTLRNAIDSTMQSLQD